MKDAEINDYLKILVKKIRKADQHIFTPAQLKSFIKNFNIQHLAGEWVTIDRFINKLLEKKVLRHICYTAVQEGDEDLVRYTKPSTSPYAIALTMAYGSYLSHGTAVEIHGLVPAPGADIYVTKEQSKKNNPGDTEILQENVDHAFAQSQRLSRPVYKNKKQAITLLKGKSSGNLGVTVIGYKGDKLPCTDLERTIIDCIVRPAYAGGPGMLATIFQACKDQLDIDKLDKYLTRLNFIYPYHQSLGYYLQTTGYDEEALRVFRLKPRPIRFYLDYNMPDPKLNDDWNIYVKK